MKTDLLTPHLTLSKDLSVCHISEIQGLLKITLSDNRVLYTRPNYLEKPIEVGEILSSDEISTLVLGLRRYLAESKAVDLLNYSENSRFMLELKLRKKDFSTSEFSKALDYLEEKKLLDDFRFAKLWLESRLKKRYEGSMSLRTKLSEKGVSSEVIDKALKATLSKEREVEICKCAIEKLNKKNLDEKVLLRKLLHLGFSYTTIKKAKSED